MLYNLRKDFLASIIVFLIALPLAIGISIACGLPIYTGIVSGIIGGIVVGSFSGNSLQVSGPAAGLILVIVNIVQTMGVEKLFLIVFVAGIIQIILGLLSFGKWFRAISPAIIQGMLAGIGISIFLSQFHIMLDSTPQNNFLLNIKDLLSVIYNSILPFDGSVHHIACMIGILTILIIVLWKYVPIKNIRTIPSALVGIIVASLVAKGLHLDIKYIEIGSNFWSSATIINPSQFINIFSGGVLLNALIVTFIASAETLLTSAAIDKMSHNSKTDYDKEIIAQGLGNSLSGLVGGLPITGVIVRSAANINAGAKTRMSAVMHGVWMLLFVSVFPLILNNIPICALAAILVYTGWKLIDINAAKYIYKISRGEFAIYMVTVISILFTNLFEGILIGFSFAIIKSTIKVLKINIDTYFVESENRIVAKIYGNVTFLQLPILIDALEKLPHDKNITLCTNKLYFIDHACIDYLRTWELDRKKEVKDLDVHVEWDEIKKTYSSFEWDTFDNNEPPKH